MPVRHFAARRDNAEPLIIEVLRKAGATVHPISSKGLPDLLVGYKNVTILAEVKSGNEKLRPAQIVFFESWQGGKTCVLRSVQDALDLLEKINADV